MSSRPAVSSDVQSSRCLSVRSGGLKAPDIGQDSRTGRQDNPVVSPTTCSTCHRPLLLRRPGRDVCARCRPQVIRGAEPSWWVTGSAAELP